jgi:hypothetical protein
MNVFLGNFECVDDVESAFESGDLSHVEILLAWYGYGSYDGSAFVLFRDGDKLYEVNGSHCSCYGLEDQWEPEETSVAELKHRVEHGNLGRDEYYDEGIFGDQLLEVLKRCE